MEAMGWQSWDMVCAVAADKAEWKHSIKDSLYAMKHQADMFSKQTDIKKQVFFFLLWD